MSFTKGYKEIQKAQVLKGIRLTGLYGRNLGSIAFGFTIVGLLNQFTPLESFRIRKAFLYSEGG